MPEKLWTEVHDIVQGIGIKAIPMENMQKSKMAVWGGLTNSFLKGDIGILRLSKQF